MRRLESCPPEILRYVTTAVSALNSAGIRVSPRRSRFMTRSLFAASIVAGKLTEKLCKLALKSSLPQTCWGVTPSNEAVAAAHRLAWDAVKESPRNWLPSLLAEKSLAGKLRILLEQCDSPDAGTQAVAELLAAGPPERAAAFAFAVYPATLEGKIPVGAEGMNDLARYASPFLSVDGSISWNEQLADEGTKHPDLVRYAEALGGLEGGRAERARQFFNGCLVRRLRVDDPAALESEIEMCVELLKEKELI
jgi:MoxR-like ATPase